MSVGEVLILDGGFGDGQLEASSFEAAGYRCLSGPGAEAGHPVMVVGLLSQYTPVTAKLTEGLPGLRAVLRYGVGLDVIDQVAANERGVIVTPHIASDSPGSLRRLRQRAAEVLIEQLESGRRSVQGPAMGGERR